MSAKHCIRHIDWKLDAASRDVHAALYMGRAAELYDPNAALLPDEVVDLQEATLLIGRVKKSFRARHHLPEPGQFPESNPTNEKT